MVFCLGLPKAQATLVLNNGGINILNFGLGDSVSVQNSPSGEPTTLNLVTGGYINPWLDVCGSSRANISGGVIGSDLSALGSSQVNISGGVISNYLYAYNSSQVSISGGSICWELYARDFSQVSISSGSIGRGLFANNSSQVNISGGSISQGLHAQNDSQLSIAGGVISGYLRAYDYSQVNIEGSGFNYPYGTITGLGLLTGILANGDPINIPFVLSNDARIVLIPPPPTFTLTIDVDPNDAGIDTITPSVGTHDYAGRVNINAQQFAKCPDVYVFDHWEGDVNDPNSANTTVFMDTDKTVTAVFVDGRQCGDECHPYPVGDLDKDCEVTFGDFALFASHWLDCTKPECD